MKSRHPNQERGSVLMLALFSVAIVAALAVVAMIISTDNYRAAHQAASWQTALLAAEAGVEVGVTEARRSVFAPGTQFSAANGWSKGEPLNADGTFLDLNENNVYDANVWVYQGNLDNMASDGAKRSAFYVVMDSPGNTTGGEPYYRLRAIGMTELTGAAASAGDGLDVKLRKLSIRTDRILDTSLKPGSSTVAGGPHATRVIEIMLKPVSAFRTALFSDVSINMTDHNIVVDSYDSTDPAKSTNGQYDVTKRQSNGNVATDGTIINAGSAYIYGNAATHDGSVSNGGNVSGTISNDFYEQFFPVQVPSVTFLTSPTTATSSMTLTATANTPSQYKLDTIKLGGSDTIRIQGAADGSPTYIQIVVTGDISITGNGGITMDKGVYARIFVKGDATIAGNGMTNQGSALALQLYGVDRTVKNADGTTQMNADGTPVVASYGSITINGNGAFKGAVYAPDYNVTLKGGGNTDSVFGSLAGFTIAMTGIQSLHYDEAMGSGGLISDYKIGSWVEDVR